MIDESDFRAARSARRRAFWQSLFWQYTLAALVMVNHLPRQTGPWQGFIIVKMRRMVQGTSGHDLR